MKKFIELPSGDIININSVEYVSKIKTDTIEKEDWFSVYTKSGNKFIFSFKNKEACVNEHNIFKNILNKSTKIV